jgi:hypothetical protein
MGAWGSGPFENDDAGDWVYDLEGADDMSLIHDALDVARTSYLDAAEGAVAVAAATVVAAALGLRNDGLSDEVTAWLEDHARLVVAADAALAVRALDRVLAERSEVAELWDDAGETTWRASVRALQADLNRA